MSEIALFGSLAKGEANAQSDIDLLVDFEPGTERIYEMKEGIKKLVGDHFQVSVDIGTGKYLKHYYKKQILSNAIFIWKR